MCYNVNSKEATMKRISTAKLRRWVLVGLGVGAAVSALLGALPIGDYGKGLALNLATELAGALITYGLLELVIGRMERREAKREAEKKEFEAKKADLIAQMGSSVKDVAVAAAEELGRYGWLIDGSLRGADLREANLQGASLYNAKLEGVRLTWANLQEAYLGLANLRRADLGGANLQGAILTGANLQKANLFEANLQGVNLWVTNLQEANLDTADLQGASLQKANLQGANLAGANLQGARLWQAELHATGFSRDTTLPDGTKWTPDTDMACFTDPDRPDFWQPDA
jgi:hypothetical protein